MHVVAMRALRVIFKKKLTKLNKFVRNLLVNALQSLSFGEITAF